MSTAPALTVEDLQRLNRLLAEGMERAGVERTAWLEALGEDDRHLRAVLVDLLNQSRTDTLAADARPPTHVARVAADALAAMRREQAGDRIGPWRLERLLAEGGMGSVWVAQRADGVLKRSAALKLPRAEWVDHGLSERIGRERAILARLQHPHIGVLYDAGVTAEGRPYLALEYVDGVPIDAYCRGRDLPAVLRLLVQVVRAVAYAHGQLVIHRDLKPANVLVSASGLPKLLDFGISKLIEGDAAAGEATALTRLSGRPMTLPYAAPEQVLGLPVTVAADVYALGVLLFELASGARLYRAITSRELEEEILRGERRRPSDVAVDKARAKALRGDLDAIVATALKRAPAERYQSAAALADDLDSYLRGEPVRARPDSGGYRLRKFVARNKLPVAAGAAVLVALAAGLGAALWQADAAREQARRATALNTFVLGLIQQADPNASQQTKQADLAMLTAIEQRIDAEFKGSPDQLLQLRVTVGDAYKNRGEMMAARRVFQRAVDDGAAHVAPDDLTLLTARVRASDVNLIVSSAASEQLDRAIEVLRRKGAPGAELLLDALLTRHELQSTFGVPSHPPAQRLLDVLFEADDVARRHYGEGSRQHLRVARVHAPIASIVRPGEGARIVATALERARARGPELTSSIEYLLLHADHGAELCRTGRRDEGVPIARGVVEQVRAAHGPTSVLLESLLIAVSGCVDPERRAAAEAYEIAAARERPPSTNLMRRAEVAFDWTTGDRDPVAGERYYQAALANSAAIPEPELRDRLTVPLRIGRVCQLAQRGDSDEVERVAASLRPGFDATFQRLARITTREGSFWVCLSHAQRQAGRAAEAARTAQTFLERCRATQKFGKGLICEQRGLGVIALAALELGQIDEARAAVEQRLALSGDLSLDPNFQLAYGRVLLATGRAREAMDVMRQSYDNWLSIQPESPFAAESLYWAGKATLAAGDRRGYSMVLQARERLARSPVASHRRLARTP